MTLEEFTIGAEFHCGDRRWRCTDIGTRVITAICLEPHEITETTRDDQGNQIMRHRITDDPSWFNGPPYAILEKVFDENDMTACTKMRP